MASDAERVAGLARVLAHETCVRLLDELSAGEATVSDLTSRLGIDQPRVSSHLALLRKAGLVAVDHHGRQRVYAPNGVAPALALATLRTLAAGVAETPARPPVQRVAEDAPVRRARTCYDHLAGVAGVGVLDRLLDRGWLQKSGERDFELTAGGRRALERRGVDVGTALAARRSFAIGCLDWTERRFHLGGALGAEILAALLRSGRARLEPGSRVVHTAAAAWPA